MLLMSGEAIGVQGTGATPWAPQVYSQFIARNGASDPPQVELRKHQAHPCLPPALTHYTHFMTSHPYVCKLWPRSGAFGLVGGCFCNFYQRC